ncbi:MAG: type I DNA topoisomerase [Planctomycetaceae bacterium]|nr:type I DNA topoisomerase [Planctomycetaceae bacterium]
MAAKRKKGLVIVESPAKAKKIGGYLGDEYIVRASVGHVRDLPAKAADIPAKFKKEPWSNLGVNVDEQFAPLYVVSPEKKKVVKELKELLKDVDELIIATDEDREGESIGWHITELLEAKVPIKRMVFSEITKKAITEALNNPREIDMDLVEAQETRRVLDRLYGYTLSPLLWKKIRPKLSAGRVQSVAVRVLVERELERLAFRSGTYWDLKAELDTQKQARFSAQLVTVDGKKVATGKDFDEHTGKIKEGTDVVLLSEEQARQLQEKLKSTEWTVASIEHRNQNRKPAPPFTTSTLQQEANRKLNMSARQAMQTAQRLYENGQITYMRTDSVTLSQEALDAAHTRIKADYGDKYLVSRQYTGKTKNAQEAHEAIRPAGTEMKSASELGLSGGEARLYDMIWKRTMASQMAEAQLRFDTVTIKADETEFRATGRHVEFPGFFKVYIEGSDDPDAPHEEEESALPELHENDQLGCAELEAVGHETKPPARYTEATLVRKLEAEGIGRPSTYASIISTIQDRGYVNKSGSQLVPTFTAMAVTRLLEDYFPNLVDLQFTAQMEQSLDDISMGQAERLPYLEKFYGGKEGINEQVKSHEEEIDPRKACTLRLDGLQADIRVGRYGPYLEREENGERVTAGLPPDIAPADVNQETAEKLIEEKKRGPQALGMHPEEGLPIFVKRGPFGPYLQLGEQTEDGEKPKRASIPNNYDPDQLDLETAIQLLALPRRIGLHPIDGKVVNAGLGRFGPYVLHAKKYGNFDKKAHTYTTDDGSKTVDILTVDMDTALEMLSKSKSRGKAEPLKVLGEHPEDGKPVEIYEGKFGPYVKHGKVNATIPKETEINDVSLEAALPWLEAKATKMGVKKAAKTKSTTKKAAKKSAKKAPTKTAAAKKTSRKKTSKTANDGE